MKKKDILIILAIFTLALVLNALRAEAKYADLSENKVQYYKNLSYNEWKTKHETQVKKIQTKINKMTEERFNKMKEMQLKYWNHF